MIHPFLNLTLLKTRLRKRLWPRSIQIARELWTLSNRHDVWNGAAALAYFLMLALFPAVIFLLTLVPFLHVPDLTQHVMDSLKSALPVQAADLLRSTVTQVTEKKHQGLLSFGLVFTLWSASTGMYAVMQQLNLTYGQIETRSYLKMRVTAVGMVFLFAFLLIASAFLVNANQWLGSPLESILGPWLGAKVNFIFRGVTLIFTGLLGFAVLYFFGPDRRSRFQWVSPGAVLGVIALAAASYGIKIYAQHFGNFASTYGSLGAAIILMLSLYVAGLIVLIGSELNAIIQRVNEKKNEAKGPAAKNWIAAA